MIELTIHVKIKKDFGDFCLDLRLQAGNEVMGLLGASGCGKSMTLNCIAGIETPDRGKIVLNGRVLFDSPFSGGTLDYFIPDSSFLSGLNIIRVVRGGKMKTIKFMFLIR